MFGGVLTELGWRWVFFVPAPIALITLIAAIRLVPDAGRVRGPRRSFDLGGATAITAAMLLAVFTVVEAPDVGWASVRTIVSFAGVAVLLSAFVALERRTAHPWCASASSARCRWCAPGRARVVSAGDRPRDLPRGPGGGHRRPPHRAAGGPRRPQPPDRGGPAVDTEIRTSRTGVWRLTVLHDRRIAVRTRVRVTRASVSLRHRAVLPDYAGADQVSVRAVAPSGESCTVGATLTASAPDRS